MIKYIFRDDEPIRIKAAGLANPQIIGEALAKIAEDRKGELTPKAVVDQARDKLHPLHPHFEWNDSLAAEAYRLDQARNLIRIVRVEDDAAQDGTSRAFISVNDGDSTAYRALDEVKKSADLQVALLKQAERELQAFERRYQTLVDICDIVRMARDHIKSRVEKSESRAVAA